MEEAAVRAMEHARRAGDVREEAMSARLLGGALLYGPAAVAEAIPRCEEIVRRAADSPMLEVAVLPILAQLYGMQGRFPEGRALFDRSRSLQDELALRYFSARMANQAGDFELLAGNAVAAEREQRRGCEIFREMGETGRFSTVASTLADALYTLGRYDEALSWTRESEEATSPDDLVSQVDWRRVRGKVLARRGEIARAEELVREALRIAETSIDDVHLQDRRSETMRRYYDCSVGRRKGSLTLSGRSSSRSGRGTSPVRPGPALCSRSWPGAPSTLPRAEGARRGKSPALRIAYHWFQPESVQMVTSGAPSNIRPKNSWIWGLAENA
jgi:tetratricopeptide (TPR) repeat protein